MEAPHLTYKRNDYTDQQISNSNQKFENGQPVMVKNHVHCTFEPEYVVD